MGIITLHKLHQRVFQNQAKSSGWAAKCVQFAMINFLYNDQLLERNDPYLSKEDHDLILQLMKNLQE